MGCDIHTYIEYKDKETKEWKPANIYIDTKDGKEFVNFYSNRNYRLFTRLAGVRGPVEEALIDPRGVPEDLSEFVRKEYDDVKDWCHSFTWYDFVELQLMAKFEKLTDPGYENRAFVKEFVEDAEAVLNHYGIFYPKPGEARIVMWFDN